MRRCVKLDGFWKAESGFTLPEMTIVVVIMGIVLAISSASWFGTIESRQVDSAADQMASDLRLAHARATNRLTSQDVTLTAGGSSYQVAGAPRTLSDGAKVDSTIIIVFGPDGSASATPAPASGSPITFRVEASDGDPGYDIQINPVTSRVEIVGA